MAGWYNRLGENGQRLTILSLLAQIPSENAPIASYRELRLQEAIDELFRLAGTDGSASVVIDLPDPSRDDPQFTTEANVALRDLADRLYQSFGHDGQTPSVLRRLTPDDGLLAGPPGLGTGRAEPSDGTLRRPLASLRRLREAVFRMFGGSAEADQPPTVLSLLVGPRYTDRHSDQ